MSIILIDRGHSPDARGAQGFVDETFITHDWGRCLAEHIALKGGECVILEDGTARDSDLSVPVNQANGYGADAVFISIHANAYSDPAAHGSEAFVYTGANSGKTGELVSAVYGAFRSVADGYGLTDRGIKEANFYVLRKTAMPAMLIELAFVTNEADAALLANEVFRNACCNAMAEALMNVAGQAIQQPAPAPAPGPTPEPAPAPAANQFTDEEAAKIRRVIALFN